MKAANTAVSTWPEMSHVGEKTADPLTLVLYPAEGSGNSTLYEDAGDGFGYENGEYARREVSCDTAADRITARVGEREGRFVPERERAPWSCAALPASRTPSPPTVKMRTGVTGRVR